MACHDHCDKYLNWKMEQDREKAALRAYNNMTWTAAKRRAKWAYIKRDTSGAIKKFSS